jgi:hypothetical protein
MVVMGCASPHSLLVLAPEMSVGIEWLDRRIYPTRMTSNIDLLQVRHDLVLP